MKTLIVTASLLCAVMALFVLSANVKAWEKANDYPYGKMCNSIFTGYVDTCRTF